MPDLVRTVFDWKYFLLYLAGSIDYSHDGGRGWRKEWTEGLVDLGIKKSQILDPTHKPLDGALFNLDNEAEIIREHRQAKDWYGMENVVSKVAHSDLRFVDKSDIVLVNFPRVSQTIYREHLDRFHALMRDLLDEFNLRKSQYGMQIVEGLYQVMEDVLLLACKSQVPTYGTMHEIVVARQQRKPVYVVWEGGIETCSGWLIWLVGHENIFPTFEDLKSHLRNVSQGKAAIDVRDWLLLNLADRR